MSQITITGGSTVMAADVEAEGEVVSLRVSNGPFSAEVLLTLGEARELAEALAGAARGANEDDGVGGPQEEV